MKDDPIVDEVHEIRRKLVEEHGGMQGYFRHLLDLQEQMKDRVVTRTPPVKPAPRRRHG